METAAAEAEAEAASEQLEEREPQTQLDAASAETSPAESAASSSPAAEEVVEQVTACPLQAGRVPRTMACPAALCKAGSHCLPQLCTQRAELPPPLMAGHDRRRRWAAMQAADDVQPAAEEASTPHDAASPGEQCRRQMYSLHVDNGQHASHLAAHHAGNGAEGDGGSLSTTISKTYH